MRDLHHKQPKPAPRNRLKKQRQPINYRAFFRKVVRVASGVVVVSFVAVAGFELYTLFARATFLRLERIDVNRLQRLNREEVVALAGIRPGDDMFSLNLRRMGEQLRKNPWVEKVKVRRYFPHTVTIELVEREPAAVVSMGYLYYVDKKGDIFKPLMEGDRLDYPVITGVTDEDMTKDPAGSREAILGVLKLVALLEKGKGFGLQDVSEIHYDKGFGYTLFTAQGGVPVRIGNGSFPEKLERFGKIYQEIQTQMTRMEYVDLDYNDKIIVKKA